MSKKNHPSVRNYYSILILSILILIPGTTQAITIERFGFDGTVSFKGTEACEAEVFRAQPIDHDIIFHPESLGGVRTVSISNAPSSLYMSTQWCQGNFDLNVDVLSYGTAHLVWDGDNIPGVTSPSGLGGINLYSDGANGFHFGFAVVSPLDFLTYGSVIKIQAFDARDVTGRTVSEATLHIANRTGDNYVSRTPLREVFVPFNSFSNPDTLAHLGALHFSVSINAPGGTDLRMGPISTTGYCPHVPLQTQIVDECGVCNGTGPGECGCNTTVTKDSCGVCGGDNTSCCQKTDQSELLARLDIGSKNLADFVAKASATLLRSETKRRRKRLLRTLRKEATKLGDLNWREIWQIDAVITSCPAAATQCATTSFDIELASYNSRNGEIYQLLKQVESLVGSDTPRKGKRRVGKYVAGGEALRGELDSAARGVSTVQRVC